MLILIAGPSGSGKSTLIAELCKTDPSFKEYIPHTTRSMRPGETERSFYFVDKINPDECMEHVEYDGYEYALSIAEYYRLRGPKTPKSYVVAPMAAANIKHCDFSKLPGEPVIIVGLVAPKETITDRLEARGYMTRESIAYRVDRVDTERELLHQHADVLLDTDKTSVAECIESVKSFLKENTV